MLALLRYLVSRMVTWLDTKFADDVDDLLGYW